MQGLRHGNDTSDEHGVTTSGCPRSAGASHLLYPKCPKSGEFRSQLRPGLAEGLSQQHGWEGSKGSREVKNGEMATRLR